MYFFPRRSYARENMFKQKLGGMMDKHTEDNGAMTDIQDSMLGFQWDPESLIPAGLSGNMPMVPGTPTTTALPTSSSSTQLPLPLPNGAAGGPCKWPRIGTLS